MGKKKKLINCRKLVSNPQDAGIAAERRAEQGDPALQPASDGVFPTAPCKGGSALPHPHREEKSNQPPRMKDERSLFFLASSFRVGRTPVNLLGLPREGHSAADQLSYGTGRGQSWDRGEQSAPAPLLEVFPNFNPCWATPSISDPKSPHASFTKFCRKLKKKKKR